MIWSIFHSTAWNVSLSLVEKLSCMCRDRMWKIIMKKYAIFLGGKNWKEIWALFPELAKQKAVQCSALKRNFAKHNAVETLEICKFINCYVVLLFSAFRTFLISKITAVNFKSALSLEPNCHILHARWLYISLHSFQPCSWFLAKKEICENIPQVLGNVHYCSWNALTKQLHKERDTEVVKSR